MGRVSRGVGTGSGYRRRVAAHLEGWFREHQDLTRALETRLQEAWSRTFPGWLEGYLMSFGPRWHNEEATE
jgi:hypothetical protein